MTRLSYKTLFIILLFLLIPIVFLIRINQKAQNVSAAWWNDSWNYRQRVDVANSSGSNLTDFQVPLSIGTSSLIAAGKMKSDCSDIRITDQSGSLLPYWIEENNPGCNQTTATKIWTKLPSLPSSGAATYLYYGNPSATNVGNGNKVFEFFDDFESYQTGSQPSKWTRYWGTAGSVETDGSSKALKLTSAAAGDTFYRANTSAYSNFIMELRAKDTNNAHFWVGSNKEGTSDSVGSYIYPTSTTVYYRTGQGTYASQESINRALTISSYHNYSLVFSNNYYKIFEDGTQRHSKVVVWASGYAEVGAYWSGEVAYFDNIRIRKYASTDPTSTPAAEEVGGAPIAYWKFDEGVGTSAYDSSGHSYHATFIGNTLPQWNTEDQCVSGKCLKFDNVTSGVSSANQNFTSLTNYTMCSWVKPLGNHKNYTGTIMSSGDWNNIHWAFGISQNNTVIQTRKADGVNSPTWNYSFSLSQWTYVCITRSGTTVTAYANGRQVGSPYTGTTGNLISNATNTTVGRETYASGYFAFNGFIDEPKIYPYARTTAQIKQDYTTGLAGMSTAEGANVNIGSKSSKSLSDGLVGYWKSDEASGNGADSSGNNNTTTISGSNNYGSGKFGNGFRSGVGATNLVTNPSVETDTTGWSYWLNSGTGTAVRSTDTAIFGSYSYKSTMTVNGSMGHYAGGYITVSPSTTYSVSGWVNITSWGGSNFTFYMREIYPTGNGQCGATMYTASGVTNGWVRFSGTCTTRADTTGLTVSYYLGNIGQVVYVDGIQIEQSSTVTPYTDGSLGTGYSWSGTAHASTSIRTASTATTTTNINDTTGSVAFWFNSPSLDTFTQCPFGPTDGDTNGGTLFGLKSSGIFLTHKYASGVTVTPQYSSTLSNNTWYHVAYTWDNTTRKGNLYINGALQQNVSYAQAITIGEYLQNLGTCTATGYTTFNGTLDDVRAYNRALSSAEVSALYNFAPGPVAYWKMDEGVGSTAYDTSGNSNNGVLGAGTSAPAWSTGKYGKALSFIDNNNYVSFGNPSNLNFGTISNFTIGFWAKTKNTNNKFPIYHGYATNPGYFFYGRTFGVSDGTNYTTPSTSAEWRDGNWHYITGTVDRVTNTIAYYVDGVQSTSASIAGAGNINSSYNFKLSGYGSIYNWDGLIDDVKIYNYARTQEQILQDMQGAGSAVNSAKLAGPLAYYKFDEGQGSVAANWGNGGTSLNATLGTGTSSPTWTNDGKFSKALTFSSSQYLSYGGTVSNVQTISYWVNASSIDQNIMDLGNNVYIKSNGFLSGLTNSNTTTYIDGVKETLGPEIVTNGNMETGNPPTGWTPSGGCTITGTADERTGGGGVQSMDIGSTDQTWVSGIPGGALTSGKLYRVSSWLKASPSYNSTIGIIFTNASYQTIAGSSYTGTTWQKSILHFVAQPTVYRYLTLTGSIPRYGRYDDVSIKEVTSVIPANSWHHVAIILDSPINIANLTVGKVGTTYFNGKLDEIKIYNYALSSDEIKTDYNQGSSVVFGSTNQTIGGTTTSLEYCLPGDSSPCSPPIAEWKMDEGVGTTAYDTSGNNKSAVFSSSPPSWTVGKFGKALLFNGSNSDLAAAAVNLTNFSISLWVKTATTGVQGILSQYDNHGEYNYAIYQNSSNQPVIQIGNDDTSCVEVTGTSVLSSGNWTHLNATYDSQTLKLFVNGILESSIGTTVTPGSGGTPFFIGKVTYQTSTNWYGSSNLCSMPTSGSAFSGRIDNVKLYNYARTPAQVAYDYNKGSPVGWWKMDECQGTQIGDWSGNANHGTLNIGASGTQNTVGTCAVGTSAAWTAGASGKFNSSLNFDDTDDYMNIGTNLNSVITSTNQVTFSAWIKPVEKATTQVMGWNYTNGIWIDGSKNLAAEINVDNTRRGAEPRYVFPSWDTWYHVVGVGNALSGYTKLYVNGKEVATVTYTPGTITTLSGDLKVAAGYGYFSGQIDDVRIYNYALTSTQIKTIYNGGSVNFSQ